jgi:hypothetical protein
MRLPRVSAGVAILAALLCATTALAADDEAAAGAAPGVIGRVLGSSSPLPTATVYAYQIADAALHKVVTDGEGRFGFAELPAGLYRVIAHKPGFLPAVVMLSRASADARQFVELQLAENDHSGVVPVEDFWSIRAEIPADVLRDIKIAEIELATRAAGPRGGGDVAGNRFDRIAAEMQAMTGVDQIAAATQSQLTGARVGIESRVGSVKLGLRGDYKQLDPGDGLDRSPHGGPAAASGNTSALSLEMANAEGTQVELTSLSNRMAAGDGDASPVDFEHIGVKVSQAIGHAGRSDFTAQYTTQANFHRQGLSDPAEIPESSTSWRFEGSYTQELSERSTFQTGIRYREFDSLELGDSDLGLGSREQIDVFGRGGLRVMPAVLMEYGLYTTLRDGSVSLIPRGGVVLQLSPTWQASALASHQVHQSDDPLLNDFVPAFYGDAGACEQNEEYCYQLVLTHQTSDTDNLSFGAIHREFSDTRRLYFSDDLFDRMESIYLVPGDRVPELQFATSRQLTPTILTRFQTSAGEGGGGLFYATDRAAYENRVRYLVTSLDTHFQVTSTGLFLAFHQLNQDLQAIDQVVQPRDPAYEAQRLQLIVTQNLNILLDLAADWALQLNMEVSRVSSTYPGDQDDGDLRKRLLGGIAIRF